MIFQLLSWFKESDMLSTKDNLSKYQFTLTTTNGGNVSLKPAKKTVIYFFAPWCSICHASIGNLQEVYQKNQEVNVIAVALDFVDKEEVIAFVARHNLTFPIAYGSEAVKQAFKIYAYPSYYVLSEDNIVLAKSMGYSTEIGLHLRTL